MLSFNMFFVISIYDVVYVVFVVVVSIMVITL